MIHNRGEVSAKTSQRVKEAITKLEYQPNLIARSLATKNIYKLAVFLPDSKDSNDYWHYPIVGVKQAISEISDHGINTQYYYFDLNNKEDFLRKSQSLMSDKPDVVITAPIFEGDQNEMLAQFDDLSIKYVLIDSDIQESSRISYVGQHSERSGQVAGRLMGSLVAREDNILIVNIVSGSDIIPVFQRRIDGFKGYMNGHMTSKISELMLSLDSSNPSQFIERIQGDEIKGIFVPGSRAHIVAGYLKEYNLNHLCIIGYDLIEGNIRHLKEGNIDFLISQAPVKQGYHGVMSLFNYLVKKENEQKNILLPIDVILKENVDDYISSIQL